MKSSNQTFKYVLLATPLGRKGQEALTKLNKSMTEDEFLDELYVKPIEYLQTEKLPEYDENKNEDEYETDCSYSDLIKDKYDKEKFRNLDRQRKNFESEIVELTKAMYLIIGSAGSGKTTYYKKIEQNFKKKKNAEDKNIYEVFFCNLEEDITAAYFLDYYDETFIKTNSNIRIFVFHLLQEILTQVLDTPIKENKVGEFCGYLMGQYHKYLDDGKSYSERQKGERVLQDSLEFKKIFEELGKCKNKEQLCKGFAAYLVTLLNEQTEDNVIPILMGFILRLFFCLSKMTNKKYICTIDSVEHYIHSRGKERLQNNEIVKIMEGIKSATDKMRRKIDIIKEIEIENVSIYTPFYGIFIMMRDTSETIIYSEHENESAYKDRATVEISEWFDVNSISQKREDYFKDKLENQDTTKKAYDYVMKDVSPYRWAMKRLVTKMYNYNKRGIVDNLIAALTLLTTDNLIWFNEIWADAIADGEDRYKKDEKDVLRQMCRQYIFRSLLDNVQEERKYPGEEEMKGYFDRIMAATEKKEQNNEATSYARRIATSLLNSKFKWKSFPYIIKSVLVNYDNTHPTKEAIADLGKILYIMNEPNTDTTHWSSLVDVRFRSEDYTEETLIRILNNEWKEYEENGIENTIDYAVKLRMPGSWFCDISPEFEYFACRMEGNTSAVRLFEPDSFNKGYNGKYIFDTVITAVFDTAIKCISEVIKREKDIDLSRVDWLYKNRVHPARIMSQFSGWLSSYSIYADIAAKRLNKSEEECSEIKYKLTCISEKYKIAFRQIRSKNKSYFENK
jgi:hypothetical protein